MLKLLHNLDDLLRGRRTDPAALIDGGAAIPVRLFLPAAVLLGAIYGSFVGWYAVTSRVPPEWQQLLASTVKLPALFLLTLVVTLPSLYVFSALTGCRLSFMAVVRLLVSTIVVNLAVAASLGPILAFFTLSTKSYPFMIVLNVGLLGAAGFVALGFLLKTLRRLSQAARIDAIAAAEEDQDLAAATLARAEPDSTYAMFYIWVIIYGLVGAQMGWLLRPFIGHPNAPFTWFRERTGNFFNAFFNHLGEVLGVNG